MNALKMAAAPTKNGVGLALWWCSGIGIMTVGAVLLWYFLVAIFYIPVALLIRT